MQDQNDNDEKKQVVHCLMLAMASMASASTINITLPVALPPENTKPRGPGMSRVEVQAKKRRRKARKQAKQARRRNDRR